MTDIVLINPGARKEIYQDLGNDLTAVEPPLWCRLIGGYLRDRDIEFEIIDAEAECYGPKALANCIAKINPKLVCMVAYGHQPSASTQQMVGAGAGCKSIKSLKNAPPILIVGGHVSALPEQTLKEEAVDYVCVGEGVITIVALYEQILEGKLELDTVPGLVWMNSSGQIIQNPRANLVQDLDKDLHGNVWDMLPMKRYRAHNWQCFGALEERQPYASIYTSLGCPFRCSFCCINAPFEVNRYRMRKPDSVVSEIQMLNKKYGIKTFKIIDEMFVLNYRHVTAICEGITALKEELNFWAYARVDTVKTEFLGMLRKAGIRWLALGIESGSTHVRDGAEKSFDTKEIKSIVRDIQSEGIHVIGNFIFGLPDDDESSMRQTLDLAKELNCEFANFYSAMAYPGSSLYHTAKQMNWPLPKSWGGYSQHSFDCLPLPTEKLSSEKVLGFRDEAFHEYFENPRYLGMLAQRFGWDTRKHVEQMAKTRLRRKLLHPVS